MENRYLRKDDKLNNFIPIPLSLLDSKLSSTTLLVYGCLLGRGILSQRNGWYDQNGAIYVRYTAPQLAKDLGKGKSTVKASLKELELAGLIERRRMGLTMTNIFIKVPWTSESGQYSDHSGQKADLHKPENNTYSGQNSSPSEVRKPDSSKYKRVNKETYHKEYVVREGESF